MKPYFTCLMLVATTVGICQSLTATIYDLETNLPLPFVNVGLVGKGLGTVSDQEGFFSLNLSRQHQSDTLRISLVGYEAQEFRVSEALKTFSESHVVYLNPHIEELQEVVLTDKKIRSAKRGNSLPSPFITFWFKFNDLGSEAGTLIKVRDKFTHLKKFHFYLRNPINRKDLKFRVNIYSLKDGKPHESLIHENIIVERSISKKNHQRKISVDLLPYDIYVDEDFFISLEWIEDLGKGGIYFMGNLLGPKSYTREVSQAHFKGIPISLSFYVDTDFR